MIINTMIIMIAVTYEVNYVASLNTFSMQVMKWVNVRYHTVI